MKFKNIVFFGGAGTSTESGISDFRSAKGIYSHTPEYILTTDYMNNNTEEFFDFYKNNMLFPDALPNEGHLILKELEDLGYLKAIITQNIDGLHQKAGNKNVLELHGSVYRNYCNKCKKEFSFDYVYNSEEIIPKCDKCSSFVRPDVTLYTEMLNQEVLNNSIRYLKEADLIIMSGSTFIVYPAAGLINYSDAHKILINLSSTQYDNRVDEYWNMKFTEGLKRFKNMYF